MSRCPKVLIAISDPSNPPINVLYSFLQFVSLLHWLHSNSVQLKLLIMAPLTASFRQSAISDTGQLHRCIRDGDFQDVMELIDQDPSLLVEPNSIGWTALHFCASHEIPIDIWKTLLQRVPSEVNVLALKTDMGLTVADQFFLRYLHPLPWQRPEVHESAKALREAIDTAIEDNARLEHFRRMLADDATTNNQNDDDDILFQFLDRARALLRLVWGGNTFRILHALSIVGCPEEVAELVIRLFPDQPSQRDEHGRLPLHLAVTHSSGVYPLETLLPNHANVPDGDGRLPIQLALNSGRTWGTGIASLWYAHPLYGGLEDSKTGFPPFLLANMPDPMENRRKVQERAAQNYQGMWRFLPSTTQLRAVAEARNQINLEQLDTIYELVRAEPSVVSERAVAFCQY